MTTITETTVVAVEEDQEDNAEAALTVMELRNGSWEDVEFDFVPVPDTAPETLKAMLKARQAEVRRSLTRMQATNVRINPIFVDDDGADFTYSFTNQLGDGPMGSREFAVVLRGV